MSICVKKRIFDKLKENRVVRCFTHYQESPEDVNTFQLLRRHVDREFVELKLRIRGVGCGVAAVVVCGGVSVVVLPVVVHVVVCGRLLLRWVQVDDVARLGIRVDEQLDHAVEAVQLQVVRHG